MRRFCRSAACCGAPAPHHRPRLRCEIFMQQTLGKQAEFAATDAATDGGFTTVPIKRVNAVRLSPGVSQIAKLGRGSLSGYSTGFEDTREGRGRGGKGLPRSSCMGSRLSCLHFLFSCCVYADVGTAVLVSSSLFLLVQSLTRTSATMVFQTTVHIMLFIVADLMEHASRVISLQRRPGSTSSAGSR